MNVKLTIASVLLLAAVDAQASARAGQPWNTTQTNTIGFRIDTSGSKLLGHQRRLGRARDLLGAAELDGRDLLARSLVRTWAMYVGRRRRPTTTPTTSGSRATWLPALRTGTLGITTTSLSVGAAPVRGGGRRPTMAATSSMRIFSSTRSAIRATEGAGGLPIAATHRRREHRRARDRPRPWAGSPLARTAPSMR